MLAGQTRGGEWKREGGAFQSVISSLLAARSRTELGRSVTSDLMANPNSILAFESRFGPQSNLIDVAAFVQSASNKTPFQVGEVDQDVVQECRSVSLPQSLVKWDRQGPAQRERSEIPSGERSE